MELEKRAREALETAVERFGRPTVARELGLHPRTLDRYETGNVVSPLLVYRAVRDLLREGSEKAAPVAEPSFNFIDLFAGIGGTRLGFEKAGGRCVFTSEWDEHCKKTYRANFGIDHEITGDIRSVVPAEIPNHDVLVAGFPCQPFSIAGVSKKNSLGRAHGFECETQGTLFFFIEKILEAKRPAAFLLENVKNLQSHDKGRTFDVIKRVLRDELGYCISHKVIDAKAFTPQHRERIFIAGFREETAFDWDQVDLSDPSLRIGSTMKDILHPENGSERPEGEYTRGKQATVNSKYVLSRKLWDYLQAYAAKHQAAGNGFGFGLVGREDTCRTLSARYYKDGSEILVSRGARARPRRLTPRECARLMGFPDSFEIPVSDTQAYKQFGNSVSVPVVEAVAKAMAPHVLSLKDRAAYSGQFAMVV